MADNKPQVSSGVEFNEIDLTPGFVNETFIDKSTSFKQNKYQKLKEVLPTDEDFFLVNELQLVINSTDILVNHG